MNKKVQASQKSYDEINFDQMPILPPSLKRSYHSPKWTGPVSLNAPGARAKRSYVTPSKEERCNAGMGRLKPC